jgi:hypothetical protein
MTSRPSTAAPILAVLAVVLPWLLAGLYVAAYLSLGIHKEWRDVTDGRLVTVERIYQQSSLTALFQGAGSAEAWLRGVDVSVVCRPSEFES